VLDGPLFAVRELDLDPLASGWRFLSAFRLAVTLIFAGRRGVFASTSGTRQNGFDELTIPLWIVEMFIGLHEVIDGEIVLAIEEPRPAPDDLLELDH
jgi:hypothetical protein